MSKIAHSSSCYCIISCLIILFSIHPLFLLKRCQPHAFQDLLLHQYKTSYLASRDWTINSLSRHFSDNRIEFFIYFIFYLQWLVKRAIETREVLGDKIRAYSISQFNKKYHLPLDDEMKAKHPRSVEAINTCKVRVWLSLSWITCSTIISKSSCSNKCSPSPKETFLPKFLIRFWQWYIEVLKAYAKIKQCST